MTTTVASRVYRAIGSPVRRRILDRLRRAPQTTGELAKSLPQLSRFAVMQHLRVLTAAKLVIVRREGRFRFNHLNPLPLQEMYDRWVSRFARPAAANVLAFKQYVELAAHKVSDESKEPGMPSNIGPAPASMIQVEIEVTIRAPRQRVWDALQNEASKWWRRDFFTSPKTKAFVIEPRIGGRAYEDYGDGNGAMWFNVTLLDAPTRVQWVGHMGGSFPGPAMCIVEINLEENGGVTVLKLRDQLIGKVDEKMIGAMESGWKLMFEDSFKPFVEGKA